uniref:Probable 26S proteasome regulatory subunit rpn-6.2 n=2 Tax=Bodo saltans TaxID=75058 RepID=B6DTK2_BODSA|nr:proteasome regulatory non-ATPase subunit 6 [Bodo saltans]
MTSFILSFLHKILPLQVICAPLRLTDSLTFCCCTVVGIHKEQNLAMSAEAEMFNFEAAYEAADALFKDGKRKESRAALEQLLLVPLEADNADGIRAKESAIYRLDQILCADRQSDALIRLLSEIRTFFTLLPKAKTTKIVRKLFDSIFVAGASHSEQLRVCEEMVAWARSEKRTFLRHRLEHRFAMVQFDKGDARESLQTINSLLREVRRLDDRALLVDIHLLESRVYYSIKNISKSRAALVAARTNANSIYCPPLAQAEIDMQSGILHAEEHDAKTAYSYLYEAFEGFHQLGDHAVEARKALRYMILAKISTDNPDELNTVLQSKSVLEYRGRDLDGLRGIADAYRKKNTHLFNKCLTDFGDAFENDPIINRQLKEMYDQLLERHLLKLVEPYQRVQVSFLAELLELDATVVEARISQLILDKKLRGIVDQQHNCLVVFDEQPSKASTAGDGGASSSTAATAGTSSTNAAHATTLYQDSLSTMDSLDKVLSAMFEKIAGKFDHLVEENIAKRKNGGAAKDDKKKDDKKKDATDSAEKPKDAEKKK